MLAERLLPDGHRHIASEQALDSIRRRDLAIVVGLTVAAAALRFATLHIQSFDEDEAVTISLLHRSFGGMLHEIPISEQTPPVYYVLAWGWSRIFGFGEMGLRSLSAALGTMLVPLMYCAGRLLLNRRAAILAAALTAFNPFLFWYSQEARSYALLVALSAAGLVMFSRALRSGRTLDLLGWSVLSALALATHYFSAFLVAPELVWLLAAGIRQQQQRRQLLATACIPVVTAIALAPLALAQRSPEKYAFTQLQSVRARIVAIPREMLSGFALPASAAWVVPAALIVLLAGALLLRNWRAQPPHSALLLIVLAVTATLAPLVLLAGGIDLVVTRNFIAVLVPLVLLVAAGLSSTRAGPFAAAALCVIWIASLAVVESDARWQRPPWREVATFLGSTGGGRLILTLPRSRGAEPLAVYLPRVVRSLPLTITTSEIDVVGFYDVGDPDRLRFLRLRPPAAGFSVVSTSSSSAFVLFRFRRARPLIASPVHPISLRWGDPVSHIPREQCCAAALQAALGELR